MKKVLFMLLVAFGVLACNGQQSNPGGGDVSVTEATGMVKQDKELVILDVRTPEEVEEGYIPGATNIDIYLGQEFLMELEKLDKSKNYYVYCRSGNRSGQACAIMNSIGIENAYNLEGGFMNWQGEVAE